MCIRDRHAAAGVDVPTFVVTALPDEKKGERLAVLHTTEEAVSYTHLRAHETVLDLVCRLLLEKKKINQFIQFSVTITISNDYIFLDN